MRRTEGCTFACGEPVQPCVYWPAHELACLAAMRKRRRWRAALWGSLVVTACLALEMWGIWIWLTN